MIAAAAVLGFGLGCLAMAAFYELLAPRLGASTGAQNRDNH